MKATVFKRPAAALFAAVSLAALIAAFFAIGQARAQQTVNPVPPPPPPTFNPSTPNTVPQPPYVPIAPAPPSGLGSTPAAPGTPAIESPRTLNPQTAKAPEAPTPPKPASAHARHHGRVHYRWRRRHGRYHPRPLGPAYYPGVGEFYPPYPNVCHFRQVWSGHYAPYWVYSCSW